MNWWDAYVGVRFADGGRGRDGLDCWGLVRLVYAEHLGIELPGYAEISARDLLAIARAIGAGQESWLPVTEPRAFDVALMRLHDRSWVGHVGVMVDARRLLHIEEASAAAIVPLDHFSIRFRLAGFRRHREATHG